MTALLIGVILVGRVAACDFCLRLPRVPFEFDHPAAIEVALATQAAAEQGQIDLDPNVTLMASAASARTVQLSTVSPRELITRWMRMRRAAGVRSLRCSMQLIFVDVDYACSLEIRFGEILEGNRENGPADLRLMTTKAGFCRLLEDGLALCEQRQLVAIEATEAVNRQELPHLFATAPKAIRPDVDFQQASVISSVGRMAGNEAISPAF